MNGEFIIDLAKVLSIAPDAILEHRLIGMRSDEPARDYHAVIDDCIASGYEMLHYEQCRAVRYAFLQRGSDRICVVSWHEPRALSCWVFKTELEYWSIVGCIKELPYDFKYVGGLDHVDGGHSVYLASRYVHLVSGEHIEFIWREKQVFPDLWDASPSVESSRKEERNGEGDKGEEREDPILPLQ